MLAIGLEKMVDFFVNLVNMFFLVILASKEAFEIDSFAKEYLMVVFGQEKVMDLSFVNLVNMFFLANLAYKEAFEIDSLLEEY